MQAKSTQNSLLLLTFLEVDSKIVQYLLALHKCETWVKHCHHECSITSDVTVDFHCDVIIEFSFVSTDDLVLHFLTRI